MKRYLLSTISFVLIVSSCLVLAVENRVLELLRKEADVNNIYNEINNIEWSSVNLETLHSLWRKDLAAFQDVPRKSLDNEVVRLAFANVLMQALRHCRIKGPDMDELHDYVLAKANSDDFSVRGRATYLLGLAGYDTDIPFLSSIIKSEQEGYAEEAALSLTFIHSEAALDALRTLKETVQRSSLKAFLQEAVEKYQSYPLRDESKTCKQQSS